jgi:hypothetical protein
MEDAIERRRDVDDAFGNLKHLLIRKMELTCREEKISVTNRRSPKFYRKRIGMTSYKKRGREFVMPKKTGKRCESNAKRRLRAIFVQRRKDFDKLNRKIKRRYQAEKQDKLHSLNAQNSREFWKSIGKLGITNERKSKHTYQVRSETGDIDSDIDSVLERWKTEYETLYNNADENNTYDDAFLSDIRNRLQNHQSYVNDIDISELNRPIDRDEVQEAILRSKLGKSVGVDEIPSEIFRNDTCMDLLYKL